MVPGTWLAALPVRPPGILAGQLHGHQGSYAARAWENQQRVAVQQRLDAHGSLLLSRVYVCIAVAVAVAVALSELSTKHLGPGEPATDEIASRHLQWSCLVYNMTHILSLTREYCCCSQMHNTKFR